MDFLIALVGVIATILATAFAQDLQKWGTGKVASIKRLRNQQSKRRRNKVLIEEQSEAPIPLIEDIAVAAQEFKARKRPRSRINRRNPRERYRRRNSG
jgi:hypothetical protein